MGVISASVALRRGEFELDARFESAAPSLALFGLSGAGKTTFLDLVAGLLRADRGTITVAGRTLVDTAAGINLPPRERRVGYVRQFPDLFPAMTVGENIAFGRRRPGPDSPAQDPGLEDTFAVSALLSQYPRELSAGETRRVQMARAVASAPKILLLDEPFANLDAAARREILPILSTLPRRFGVPTVLVTHEVDEVFAFADEVVLFERGAVVAQGEPAATLSRPGAWPVARISGVENFLRVRIGARDALEGGTIVDWEGELLHCPSISGDAGSEATLALFAEDVIIGRGPVADLSARNILRMRVEEVVDSGDTLLVSLSREGRSLRSRITRGARTALSIEPGVEVSAIFKSSALRPVADGADRADASDFPG